MDTHYTSDKEVVAVIGLGYVGCVTAACLADLGNDVIGVDRDEGKLLAVTEGRAPFFEPGLEELISRNTTAGRLRVTQSLAEALESATVAMICVGTPSERNGNLDLRQLLRVAHEIGDSLKRRDGKLIVVVRSTVFPGTCEEVVAPALGGSGNSVIVSNPEFLREGCAVKDFIDPPLIVVGGSDFDSVQRVASLYAPLKMIPNLTSLRTAEMIKYACNAFHALKIAFANEIGALSADCGIDADEVMGTLCSDHRLNISPAYLRPGFPFGGSCLPKDLRALVYRARRLDLKLPLMESVLPSNNEHLTRAVSSVLELAADRIGILGLAFKENTDDLRESPVVTLLETLIGKGRNLRVYDPHIRLNQIYGSNERFIRNAIPHIGRLLDASFDDTLAWADCLVIAQKPSPECAAKIQASGIPTLDLTGHFAALAPQARSHVAA